ncbi:MAG: hypothetical protein R3195_02395 [Gemmatimonadota bacterium]|nr:hypothetical protein [Gemmatimonadota bacterium]
MSAARQHPATRAARLAVAVSLLAGCSSSPGGLDSDGSRSLLPVVLQGATESIEQLAFEALEGLSAGDVGRLERIRLTEYEHNQLVYPQLPASAPEVNHPADLAWGNIQRRNHRARGRLIYKYGGHALSLLGVECRADPEYFRSFRVLRDCWVSFTVDRERVDPVQLFKYVLDWDGQFKIFRYYDDD